MYTMQRSKLFFFGHRLLSNRILIQTTCVSQYSKPHESRRPVSSSLHRPQGRFFILDPLLFPGRSGGECWRPLSTERLKKEKEEQKKEQEVQEKEQEVQEKEQELQEKEQEVQKKEQEVHKKEQENQELSLFQRYKKMLREYWYVLVPVHIATSAIWFGGFYYAATQGLDIVPFLEYVCLPEFLIEPLRNSSLGHLAVASALYKLATPARYMVTLGASTTVVKQLTRRGLIRPAPTKAQIKTIIQNKMKKDSPS